MAVRRRQPIPTDAPPVLRELVTELRALVDRCFPSLRELEKVAHVSRSSASDALSGRRLPSLEVILAIVRACGGDEPSWRERWLATRVTLLDEADQPTDQDPRPNPGHLVEHASAAQLAVQPLEDADPRRIGPFQVRGVVGSGSMGRVYLAESPGRRLVAVKVMRPELAQDAEFRRRFRREVDLVRRVQGVFTAQVVDADPDAPRPWLATTYVPAPSLRQVVSEHGPLPLATVLHLAVGTAEALRGIHAAGVVHRDASPGNVLLAVDGPCVIDFGIAHAVEGSFLSHTATRWGTASFMAPEQVTGGQVGPATDVFALGALLTFAATGTPPFGWGPAEAILYRVVHDEPDLAALARVDTELSALVARCLDKDPDERPTLREIEEQCQSTTGPTAVDTAWLPAPLAAQVADQDRQARTGPRRRPAARSGGRLGGWWHRRPLPARVALASALPVCLALVAVLLVWTGRGGPGASPADRGPASSGTSTGAPHRTSTATSTPSSPDAVPATSGSVSAAGSGQVDHRTMTTGERAGALVPGARAASSAVNANAVGAMSGNTANDWADWGPFWHPEQVSLSTTAAVTYQNAPSLWVQARPVQGQNTAVGTTHVTGLAAGMTVTMQVWYGGQGDGLISPFVQTNGSGVRLLPGAITVPRATGWTTLRFTVPADVTPSGLGVQLDVNDGIDLDIAVNAVSW